MELALNNEMRNEINTVMNVAESLIVDNDEGFAEAGKVVSAIKFQQKKVKDFFEPMRKQAKAAYDAVLNRKKEFLTPLEEAEKIIKDKMVSYEQVKEQERRKLEEQMRAAAKKEVDAILAEAVKAEENGDAVKSEMLIEAAGVYDDVAVAGKVANMSSKAEGVSRRKNWIIKSVDPNLVPIEIVGAVIRPVDEKAVLALIKATKGSIQIPGIEFEETITLAVRA